MKKVILVWQLATLILASVSWAQQPHKTYRIGFLGGMSAAAFGERMDVFRKQFRELGYSEGKNITFEERWADGKLDRLGDMASDLVKTKVDVLVTFGGPAPVIAAKKATTTVPIVMASGGSDPVATGFVASLARPGGNITGLTNSFSDLRGKQVELLKEAIPKLSRVSYLWHPSSSEALSQYKEMESEARKLGLRIQSLELHKTDELEKIFQAAKQERVGAILVGPTRSCSQI
jgi:putative ABC transport system substrate-binding protein